MRKAVVLLFLIIGLMCLFIIYGPDASHQKENIITYEELLTGGLKHHLIYALVNATPRSSVEFSHKEHFYTDSINVAITSDNPDAVIYYTTDGSHPTAESCRYTKPLEFTSEENVKCTVLKAVAIDEKDHGYGQGLTPGQSSVATHTYFVGRDAGNRFSTYVFSLSAGEDGLYGYENGILVPGKIYDDYMKQNPDTDTPLRHRPANYSQTGMKWERPVYAEVFTYDGEKVISQYAGLRVHGGVTRSYPQKSLRLIARWEYDMDKERFNYGFFGDYPVDTFETLILRNDGNDYQRARIRDRLASTIAYEAGFDVVSPQAQAAVFINGEYYGYLTVNVFINEQYLGDLYNAPAEYFEICDGGSYHISTDDTALEAEFERLIQYAQYGFTGDTLTAAEDFFDIDNMLLYYALGAYTANSDWPQNNVKIWRYTGPVTSQGPLDGRWRFIMYDFDQTFHYTQRSAPDTDTMRRLREDRFSPVLAALLDIPEYAAKWEQLLSDMAYIHFTTANVDRVIGEINEKNLRELEFSAHRWNESFDELLQAREQIREFTRLRPQYMAPKVQ